MSRPPYLMPVVAASDDAASDDAALRPGSRQLVTAVVQGVASGRLPVGARLAPVRVVGSALGIARSTVQAAYDELASRGVVETRPRRGVFVAAPSEARFAARLAADEAPGRVASAVPIAVRAPVFGAQRRVAATLIDISTPFVDPALLPGEQLAECVRSVLHQPGWATFYDPQGHVPLREAIAARLRARGMDVQTDDVVVTCGSQQALDLAIRALEVRSIAHEDPVYAMARHLFASLAQRTTALPLSPFEPLARERWESALAAARPSLLYTITSYHNPTGRSYDSRELEWLLETCARHGVGLLEDDWGSDMLPERAWRPTLRALGGREVLYVNSFTKKLWPSLRLGFVAGNERTVGALVEARRLTSLGGAVLLEAALFEFLDRGYYDTHLERLQSELERRYRACLGALRELMPAGVRWTEPGGGPTVWLELPGEVALEALRERLARRGVGIVLQGEAFSAARPHLNGFALAYARHTPEVLREALGALREALDG